MNRFKLIFILLIFTAFFSSGAYAIGNPSAIYCEELGYNYENEMCILPDLECSAWDFYYGECGEEYGNGPQTDDYSSESLMIENVIIENYDKAEPIREADLNDYFDWRDIDGEDWMTPVKDQEICGSCWAFSTLGSMEAKINIARNDSDFDLDLSEQHLVSDCFPDAGDCDGGTIAFYFLVDGSGVVDEACYPYASANSGCSPCEGSEKRGWTVDGYKTVSDNIDQIKNYLVQKGPLSALISMSGSSFIGGVLNCPNGLSNHAVVIVGYNETGKYWIVKNSWGTDYQDNGYFKVAYNNCSIQKNIMYPELIMHPTTKQKNVSFSDLINLTSDGSVENINIRDGNYFNITPFCDGACDPLSAKFNFTISDVSNIETIDLYTYQKTNNDETFGFSYWNTVSFETLGEIGLDYFLVRYHICDSQEECSEYINNILIDYRSLTSGNDWISIDWLSLETTDRTYCEASSGSDDFEYISRIQFSNIEIESGPSIYTPAGESVGYLDMATEYTLQVDANSDGETVFAKAWIDFNDDTIFTEDEEIYLGSSTFSGTHTFIGTFTVSENFPEDVKYEDVLIRIILETDDMPTACDIFDYGEVEDYFVTIINDTGIPELSISDYGINYVQKNSNAVINVNASDDYGIESVYAKIQLFDDPTETDYLKLFDDGNHNDVGVNDGIYGNVYRGVLQQRIYYVDFNVTDIHGNTNAYDNLDKFTSVPFTRTADIFLIENSNYEPKPPIGKSDIYYYKQAITYDYDLWDIYTRGQITPELINDYSVIIWHVNPIWNEPSGYQQDILANFLDNGGKLFIAGENLGSTIGNTTFYQNYIRAVFVSNDIDLLGCDIKSVDGDLITDGLELSLLNLDGNIQESPDEIDTTATPIIVYNDSCTVNSSGTAALRVDDTYKLVYLGFGLESISQSGNRTALMTKIIDWFDDSGPRITTIDTPSDSTYSSTKSYKFSADVLDVYLEDVIFELNGENYTLSSGDLIRNGTNYYISFIGLDVNTYYYKWYASDGSETNETEIYSFKISASTSPGGGGGSSSPINAVMSFGEKTELSIQQSAKFTHNGESHSIKLNSVSDNSATFTVSSTPQVITLYVNETEKLDLNGDSKNDIEILLLSISRNRADIKIIELMQNEEIPEPRSEAVADATFPSSPTGLVVADSTNSNDAVLAVFIILIAFVGIKKLRGNKREFKYSKRKF